MRLAKSFVTLIALLGLLAWVGPDLRAQAQPSSTAPQAAKQPEKKPATSKPAAQAAPAAKPQGKAAPAAKQPEKKPAAPKPAAQAAPAAKPQGKAAPAAKKAPEGKKSPLPKKAAAAAVAESRVVRRDPFDPLVGKHRPGGGIAEHLPPGKAGLVVATLRVDGIVRGPSGMLAVVSNPQLRVYFLREGDQLYDGRVERITMDAVAFHETGKDAFGNPVERQVTKRLYPSAGEQR